MGTRADFYIGRTDQAEWLGSIAFDGYPDGIDHNGYAVFRARTDEAFRNSVTAMLADCDHATTPDMGWPWPWDDSGTTDFAYALDDGQVYASSFGGPWFTVDADTLDAEPNDDDPRPTFPDMSARKAVTYGKRSGAMFLSFGGS